MDGMVLSPTETMFTRAIDRAVQEGNFVDPSLLLSMDSLTAREDVSLLYAEGWSLVPTFLVPSRRAELMSQLGRQALGHDDDPAFWAATKSRMIANREWMSEMMPVKRTP
jgi:hypothetical protein